MKSYIELLNISNNYKLKQRYKDLTYNDVLNQFQFEISEIVNEINVIFSKFNKKKEN